MNGSKLSKLCLAFYKQAEAAFWDEQGKYNKDTRDIWQDPNQLKLPFKKPDITYQQVTAENLSKKNIKQLKRLTIGAGSNMSAFLNYVESRRYLPDNCIILAKDKNKIVGWILGQVSNEYKRVSIDTCVDKAYRNIGIGKNLYLKLKNIFPEYEFSTGPWNDVGFSFYQNVGAIDKDKPNRYMDRNNGHYSTEYDNSNHNDYYQNKLFNEKHQYNRDLKHELYLANVCLSNPRPFSPPSVDIEIPKLAAKLFIENHQKNNQNYHLLKRLSHYFDYDFLASEMKFLKLNPEESNKILYQKLNNIVNYY